MFIIVKCIEEGHDFHQQECLQVYSKVFDGVALKKNAATYKLKNFWWLYRDCCNGLYQKSIAFC